MTEIRIHTSGTDGTCMCSIFRADIDSREAGTAEQTRHVVACGLSSFKVPAAHRPPPARQAARQHGHPTFFMNHDLASGLHR